MSHVLIVCESPRKASLRLTRRLSLNAPDHDADPVFVRNPARYAYTIFQKGGSWTLIDVTIEAIEQSPHEMVRTLSHTTTESPLSRGRAQDLSGPDQRL